MKDNDNQRRPFRQLVNLIYKNSDFWGNREDLTSEITLFLYKYLLRHGVECDFPATVYDLAGEEFTTQIAKALQIEFDSNADLGTLVSHLGQVYIDVETKS